MKTVDKVKFTPAGFPIHDYLKEMKQEREKKQRYHSGSEQAKHTSNHDNNTQSKNSKLTQEINIVENINRELKLERQDRNYRRTIGALSSEE